MTDQSQTNSMTFLQRLAQVINANGYANQVVVMDAANPLFGSVSAIMPPSNDGFPRLFPTLQLAVDSGAIVPYRGDEILVAPGVLDETVTIPGTNVLTGTQNGGFKIIGLGGRGDCAVAPSTAGAKAVVNNADDVTIINLDMAGNTTATSALFSTGSRLRLVDCKVEGVDTSGAAITLAPGSVAQVAAGTAGNCGDVDLGNVEICWSKNGLELKASDYGVPTQVVMTGARIHNVDGTEIIGTPGAFGIDSVRNLEVVDCILDRMEDGTKPSDFIDVNGATDTGLVTGCRIALATNAVADLKVGAGILWVANMTEAGVSTARPA